MLSANSLLAKERAWFHSQLIERGVLSVNVNGIASNADKSSKPSTAIAFNIAQRLLSKVNERQAGQTSGMKFEVLLEEYLQKTFPLLQHLRPGRWEVLSLGNNSRIKTSTFAQYEHLEYLQELANANSKLKTILGNDYMVAPDVVVYRKPLSDEDINTQDLNVVNEDTATLTELRARNSSRPLLLASISAKWTMRSDRAQNSRTEALNLIRNRKGQVPHIMVVTAEPLPSRIASLALGTGDIDCMYHFALYELLEAVKEYGREDILEQLDSLITGKRLKDISDLPIDLCM